MSFVDYSEIDFEELASKVGVGSKHIPLLLGSFVSESLEGLETLQEAISKKDYEVIATVAHSIKGSASNLHIQKLAEQAKELELMAKEKNTEYMYEKTLISLQESIKSFKQ